MIWRSCTSANPVIRRTTGSAVLRAGPREVDREAEGPPGDSIAFEIRPHNCQESSEPESGQFQEVLPRWYLAPQRQRLMRRDRARDQSATSSTRHVRDLEHSACPRPRQALRTGLVGTPAAPAPGAVRGRPGRTRSSPAPRIDTNTHHPQIPARSWPPQPTARLSGTRTRARGNHLLHYKEILGTHAQTRETTPRSPHCARDCHRKNKGPPSLMTDSSISPDLQAAPGAHRKQE